MEKLFYYGAWLARTCGIPISSAVVARLHHMTRVGLVGLTCFVLQTTVFEIIGIRLGLVEASTAALIGGEIAVLTGFTLNNYFNFRDRNGSSLWRRLVMFHLVVSGSLFTQWTLVRLAEIFTDGEPMLLRGAFLLGVAIGFTFNYAGYHLFVWRR